MGADRRDDPRFTACWALQDYRREVEIYCGTMTDDPLGLCPEHRHEIVGNSALGALKIYERRHR